MLDDLKIEKIKSILVPELAPYFIILFGSVAGNRERKDSDIDLAFLSEASKSDYDVFMIAQKLANVLGREIDLLDLNKASTVMQMQIIHYGKEIYCTNEKEKLIFEMKVYKMYAKLSEERQVVLQAIKESGEVYGWDIILNKIGIIDRCLKRIHEEYDGNPENLQNYTKQDSIILNIQRACEASIDLAMHLVAQRKLGIPQSSREAFDFLHENDIISKDLSTKMKAMVGFRNIAVHDYRSINISILQKIVEVHLADFNCIKQLC